MLWAASRALGWSPFDARLQGLSFVQMEWAIFMADSSKREDLADQRGVERDRAAVLLLEWWRTHVTRG